MQAKVGKRVRISFICRLEDGTVYDVDRDALEFIIGRGNTPPTLELGVIGMKPGEHRMIRVPATEVNEFSFEEEKAPTGSHLPAGSSGPDLGYDFAPGGDDVLLAPPPRSRSSRRSLPAGGDLIFDVLLVRVEDADVQAP